MTTIAADLDRELNDLADAELRGERTTSPAPQPVVTREMPRERDLLDDRNLAVITHIGTVGAAVFTAGFLDIIVPAVGYFLVKDRSDFLKDHMKEQLNFQLTMLLVTIIGAIVTFVTFGIGAIVAVPALLFFFVVDIVCSIKAALAASRGEHYTFPFSIDFLK